MKKSQLDLAIELEQLDSEIAVLQAAKARLQQQQKVPPVTIALDGKSEKAAG